MDEQNGLPKPLTPRGLVGFFSQHACPPFCVATDDLTVVHRLARGKQWCVAPRRAHTDLWRDLWLKIEDLGLVGTMR